MFPTQKEEKDPQIVSQSKIKIFSRGPEGYTGLDLV